MKRICVVTGSRADYGPMRPLLFALRDAADFDLDLVAMAPHVTQKTLGEIQRDGLAIRLHNAYGMFENPDAVIVLGDRAEILYAAVEAYNASRPLIHLYGGELTEGSSDDARRHAITKLADLHFAAAEPYRERIIRLGEDPARVFTVGEMVVDTAMAIPREPPTKMILCTFHPCGDDAMELIGALDHFADYNVIITGPNSDPGGAELTTLMRMCAQQRADRGWQFIPSLGHEGYLRAAMRAAVVVGNSSSGLIEVPALGTPTVNVGDRQGGRIRTNSVIDCANEKSAIIAAIDMVTRPWFRESIRGQHLPYGGGGSAQKILAILRETDLATLGIKRSPGLC